MYFFLWLYTVLLLPMVIFPLFPPSLCFPLQWICCLLGSSLPIHIFVLFIVIAVVEVRITIVRTWWLQEGRAWDFLPLFLFFFLQFCFLGSFFLSDLCSSDDFSANSEHSCKQQDCECKGQREKLRIYAPRPSAVATFLPYPPITPRSQKFSSLRKVLRTFFV